jgi:hypothetical protein
MKNKPVDRAWKKKIGEPGTRNQELGTIIAILE